MDKAIDSENFRAKHDEGKLQLRLVPPQIIRDIAEVRMYGNAKYGDPDNWKTVEKWRYIDALFRHFLLYLEDPEGVDEESGIKHYKHMACNMAFICAMEAKDADLKRWMIKEVCSTCKHWDCIDGHWKCVLRKCHYDSKNEDRHKEGENEQTIYGD